MLGYGTSGGLLTLEKPDQPVASLRRPSARRTLDE
jgi:hypothetical protein